MMLIPTYVAPSTIEGVGVFAAEDVSAGALIVELDNGRFMNHSEHPNTRFDDPDAGFALRRIRAGEELTCNYSEFDPTFEILPGRLFVEAQ
jgi:hypothetical protein